VLVRGDRKTVFERQAGESSAQFLQRLRCGEGSEVETFNLRHDKPTLAALFDGDMELPEGSPAYILKPGALAASMSASDFLS